VQVSQNALNKMFKQFAEVGTRSKLGENTMTSKMLATGIILFVDPGLVIRLVIGASLSDGGVRSAGHAD
jgi:hypothetical protein